MQTPLRAWLDKQPKPHAIERLAEESGVPLRSLYRYANGTRQPPLHHAVAISRVTSLAIESLVKPSAESAA